MKSFQRKPGAFEDSAAEEKAEVKVEKKEDKPKVGVPKGKKVGVKKC